MLSRFLGAKSCQKINYAIQNVKNNTRHNKTYGTNRYIHINVKITAFKSYNTMFSSKMMPMFEDYQVNLGSLYFAKRFLDEWQKHS